MESISIESTADDGLFGIVNRAQTAVAGEDKQGPVGVLEIDLEPDGQEGTDVQIEAAYAHKGARRVLQRLDVHVRARLDQVEADKLLGDAIADFGGQKFTNICLSLPGTTESRGSSAEAGRIQVPGNGVSEALDLTVYFPSRVPFYAKNLALLSDELAPGVLDDLSAVLAALGVKSHRHGAALVVATRQLRGRVTRDQQLAAYREASARKLGVSLYAATLPTTQSMRVAESSARLEDGSLLGFVDCQLSHGLTPDTMTTPGDTARMQKILKRHFGLELGKRHWQVQNLHGEPGQDRPEPERYRIKWAKGRRW